MKNNKRNTSKEKQKDRKRFPYKNMSIRTKKIDSTLSTASKTIQRELDNENKKKTTTLNKSSN